MQNVLTVGQLTLAIKNILENNFQKIWVEGEISNYKHHSSGHMYFSLKDQDAQIRCVMFKGRNRYLNFRPQNGTQVRAQGRVGVWPPQGSYQFYVDDMQPAGLGALYQAFEQLKLKLQKEGLFNPELKKTIPVFPKRVGVVTSPTGAAIRDIVNVISRRFPLVDLMLCPARVQGEGAAREVVSAIRTFEQMPEDEKPDVLIVGRGGGSIEDLWPFNEEITARAIFSCSIPVISAVGHEIDFTIADFVADKRAPTPSAGAEEAVPDKQEIRSVLAHLNNRLCSHMKGQLTTQSLQLQKMQQSDLFKPRQRIADLQLNIDHLADQMEAAFQTQMFAQHTRLHRMNNSLLKFEPGKQLDKTRNQLERLRTSLVQCVKDSWKEKNRDLDMIKKQLVQFDFESFRHRINVMEARMNGHNPRLILKKGYAICSKSDDGAIVSSIDQVATGQKLDIELLDGTVITEVKDTRRINSGKQ